MQNTHKKNKTPRERIITRLNKQFGEALNIEIPLDQPIKKSKGWSHFDGENAFKWHFWFSEDRDFQSQFFIAKLGSYHTMTELLASDDDWIILADSEGLELTFKKDCEGVSSDDRLSVIAAKEAV